MEKRQRKRPGPPEKVGPYRLAEQLGSGGMGEVYRAYDERLRRWVAIKQLLPEIAKKARVRERFRREARSAAGLNHPAIVQIFDILEGVERHDWIVMELVEGRSLKNVVAEGPLGPEKAIRLGREIAEGLASAHAQGIVHRDLKIENVMVTPSGRPKILDFGLAKDYERGSDSSTLSSQAEVLGTSRAMSPEQVKGLKLDPRSDLFSLGTLLFEILTGESPFKAANAILTLARVCSHQQPPVRDLNPNVPLALSDLVDRLLGKEPEERPRSAREVAAELAQISGNGALAISLPQPRSSESGTWDASAAESTDGFYIKTLVQLILVDRGRLVDQLGDVRAYEVLTRHDRMIRDLLAQFGGLEVDKNADGFLLFFDRPVDAVEYALAYHDRVIGLAGEVGVRLRSRAGIHLGEVFLRENLAEDVARGAKHLEVEGRAKRIVARLGELARSRQTLVTREAFDLAQRALAERGPAERGPAERAASPPNLQGALQWMSHGVYRLAGLDDELGVFEVGRQGVAPLTRPRRRIGPWRWAAAAAALVILGTTALTMWLRPEPRATVAVLGFKNLSRQADDAWLSTALAELLSTELAVSGELRLIPGEAVARMKHELSLTETETLAGDTLQTIGTNLGTEFVVVGSYLVFDSEGARRLLFSPVLQSTTSGETVDTWREEGIEAQLLQLVSRTGAGLRRSLGVGRLSIQEEIAVRATLPASPAASRFYSEGLVQLRDYDALGARESFLRALELEPGYAPAHAALSEAWSSLGYDDKARARAERAFELSRGLPRETELRIEARSHEMASRWPQAVRTYGVLWDFYPDDLEYGLRLAEAQIAAGQLDAATETVQALRQLETPAREDARIDMVEATVARKRWDHEAELQAAGRAEAKGRQRQASLLVADALQKKGWALRQLGRMAPARDAFEEARRLFAQAGDKSHEAQTLNALGILEEFEGDLAEAEELFRASLEIHRATGNEVWTSWLLTNLALVLENRGRLDDATALLEEGVEITARLSHRPDLYLAAAQTLVWIEIYQGRLADAERRLEEVRKRPAEGETLAWRYATESELAYAAGELEKAQGLMERALAVAEQGRPGLTGSLSDFAAQLHLAAGELEAAAASAERAVAIFSELGEHGPLARAELTRAEVLSARGPAPEVVDLLARVRSELERQDRPDDVVLADLVLAEALWSQGERDAAREALRRAEVAAARSQRPALRLTATVRAARRSDEVDEALRELTAARAEARQLGLAGVELEARLALGEIELAAGRPEGRQRLASVAEEAGWRGFKALASQATAALAGEG